MATKDYVYLALITLAALVFYLHGYAVGAADRRRKAKASGNRLEAQLSVSQVDLQAAPEPRHVRPRSEPLKIIDAVHCFFGNN